jgi:hypothetical protein
VDAPDRAGKKPPVRSQNSIGHKNQRLMPAAVKLLPAFLETAPLALNPVLTSRTEFTKLLVGQARDPELLQRATNVGSLPENWKTQLLLTGQNQA